MASTTTTIKSSSAHLICLGNSKYSTEVSLFDIPIGGSITIGSNDNCNIVLKGILPFHCRCVRKKVANDDNLDEEEDDVILSPIGIAKVYVEGILITDDYILQQGDTITLGDNSIFLRFNFPAKAALLKNNAAAAAVASTESNKRSINDNYQVLKKNINTNCVNFTEFSMNSDKTLNNNVKITDKMKNLKMKANDSYPKINNLQVYPVSSKSIENCANVSNSNNNLDEMQKLEDVLKMFIEYNNNNNDSVAAAAVVPTSSNSNQSSKNNILQTSSDKINVTHQNRIKTNGSLPKNFHTKDHAHNFDFFDNDPKTTDDIEIYKKPQSPRTRIRTFVSSPSSISSSKSLSPTDNNDKSYDCDKATNGLSSSSSSYENGNEKDYEKLIKSFEEKFRMDIFNIQNCENLTHSDEVDTDNHLHSSDLSSEKNEILTKIRELKILISDIHQQETETLLENSVEKSLVLGEMSNAKQNLTLLNEKLAVIKNKMKQLEIERLKRQKQQEIQQIKLKNTIKDKEAEIKMLKDQREVSVHTESRLAELEKTLEIDIKTYEDLEFHYLEEETEWASLLEEYKENINEFTRQIEDKKNYIYELEQTKRVNENSTESEQKSLEKKLFNLKQKLENEREKLKNIDKLLSLKSEQSHSSKTNSIPISNSPSAYTDNSLSKATAASTTTTTDLMSKSFNENMFFNRNKIEVSYFDFNLTTESLPRNSKIAPATKSSINVAQFTESANNSPLMMPKYYQSTSSISYSNDNSMNLSSASNGDDQAAAKRTTSSAVVQPRQMMKKQRPLTRFMPNFSLDFNLRNHIETAGHQIQLCPHIIIDANSCRGWLNKVGSKPLFSNLRDNKRWFVFDRNKQMFVYYSNKNEKKPRGGAYFQAISDVYFDHSALERTFIVKTKTRSFTLQAPSTQACSIWIDVIITGALGKLFEYEK